MDCLNRKASEAQYSTSLSDALFTTMCIIGLPVEVHITDGSVYSGIFHTAYVHNGYDIVLKKAMKTKKGKNSGNVQQDKPIETLVILSRDLVQVVAKGILFLADAVGEIYGQDLDAFGDMIPSSRSLESEGGATAKLKSSHVDEKHQVANGRSQGVSDNCKQQFGFQKDKTISRPQDPNLTCKKPRSTEIHPFHTSSCGSVMDSLASSENLIAQTTLFSKFGFK